MTPFDVALLQLYRERGLVVGETPVHLPTACPRASACWSTEPARRIPDEMQLASQVSAPWVGSAFDRGRLLVVLENLRDYGGLDFGPEATIGMRFLGNAARRGFAQGHKVLFSGGRYAGTSVWYQAARYAGAWLSALGVVPDGDSGPGLANVMDHIAIAQHVKCSPCGGRNAASGAMFANCGKHVLAAEIDVMRPLRVLVVGAGRNRAAMDAHVLTGTRSGGAVTRRVRLGKRYARIESVTMRTPDEATIDVVYVPHPATPGGTARALVDAVKRIVAEGC